MEMSWTWRSPTGPSSTILGKHPQADLKVSFGTMAPSSQPKSSSKRTGTSGTSSKASRRSSSRRGKPTLVLLVRHGKTPTTGQVLPGRTPGLHLAPEGVAQAEAAAERIAKLAFANPRARKSRVTAVYASPMERTRETAAPIAKALGHKVTINRGLLEADFGQWTGRKLSDLNKKPEWTQVQKYPSGFRFPGGESFSEMQQRITGAIQDLVSAHAGETIVAVSHADPIKAAVADAMGTHLDLFQRIVIGQCSISAIMYGEGGPVVLAVNSMGDDLRTLVPS